MLSVNLSIEQGSETIYSWSGTTEDGCVVHSATAEEGKITVVTMVEEGVRNKNISHDLATKRCIFWRSYFVFNWNSSLAFGETFVRYIIAQRIEKTSIETQDNSRK